MGDSTRNPKTAVIETLFFERWEANTRKVSDPAVTFDDLYKAAAACGLPLSSPANFVRDLLRSPRRNDIFPANVFEAGYTLLPWFGADGCAFKFVRVEPGQPTPFPAAPAVERLASA